MSENKIYSIDRCDSCLSPENFYLYASNNRLTKLQYSLEYPCHRCEYNLSLKKGDKIK